MSQFVVRSEALTTHHDDRGNVTELIHCYDLPQVEYLSSDVPGKKDVKHIGQFGQTYVVRNEQVGTIRAFHRHERLWDYFTVVNGKAQVWIISPNRMKAQRFILDAGSLSRLAIPPTWWHGWESLMPNTIMICTGSEVYDREKPDEERVPFYEFEDLNVKWGVTPQ